MNKDSDDASVKFASLTAEQIYEIKDEAIRSGDYAGRVSVGLAMQMLVRYYAREDYFPILDEIQSLEVIRPVSQSKPATQFRHKPLYPFWHKHFWTARHLINNIDIHWGKRSKGNAQYNAVFREIAKSHGDNSEAWQKMLGHALTIGAFEARSADKKLTGDWIIFAKHEGQNYYLGVSEHTNDDSALYKQLRNFSAAEFPFLFDHTT